MPGNRHPQRNDRHRFKRTGTEFGLQAAPAFFLLSIVSNLSPEMMQYLIDSKTDKLQKFDFHDSVPDRQVA